MGRVRLTIQDMQQKAKERGGRCLLKRYGGSSHKLLWECSEGHRWKSIPNSIRRGVWCPKCATNKRAEAIRLTIEDMQKTAAERRGRCLSKCYKNVLTKLLWECAKGHRWEALPINVKAGTWCPQCAKVRIISSKRWTIEEIQELAKARGGKCLSKVYLGYRSKLWWECHMGHKWEAVPEKIKRGSWCLVCARL